MAHAAGDGEGLQGALRGPKPNPFTAYALSYVEWVLGGLGSYAYGVAMIHDTHRVGGADLDGFLQFTWRAQEAPEELKDGAR